MRYRRVLLLAEVGADASPALAAVRRLGPSVEHLTVVACPPPQPFRWGLPAPSPPALEPARSPWLEWLRGAAAAVVPGAEVGAVPSLETEALLRVLDASGATLVVAGPQPPAALSTLAELRKRRPVAVLWVPEGTRGEGPYAAVFCVALGSQAGVSVARFLADHGDPDVRATVLTLAGAGLGPVLTASGVRAAVELVDRVSLPPWGTQAAPAHAGGVDLVVLPRLPTVLLRSAPLPAPVLVLPPPTQVSAGGLRPLDVADVVVLGDAVRLRLGHAYGVGRNPLVDDQEVAVVVQGQLVAVVHTRDGQAELPATVAAGRLGLFRARDRAGEEPASAVEREVAVVRPGPRPLVLFDAELADEELVALARAREVDLLAVRLLPERSCHLLREHLRDFGLEPRVVDASAVLDEGFADDVSETLGGVRLVRVAARLRVAGYPVVAVVPRGSVEPSAEGLAVVRASDVAAQAWTRPTVTPPPASLAERLEAVTAAPVLAGNRVELELDNVTARTWLLGEIAAARQRVHLQTYMAADDETGRRVEAALVAAAQRGVEVRVLVDSLHGLHGSFGLRNPLLERLAAAPGVELRVWRPVEGVPSLEELKQRDHRKLLVADGRVALVGGRNLAHEYYTGFSEVPVTAETPWRQVPWLDAGARVEGPAVAALERAFREAWAEAGGAPFEVVPQPAAGSTPARVVVHHGLRDARTLEAYLALVDSARSHVVALTGFPLVLELQHALLRALRRGVRVRVLFSQVTPAHGSEPFEGDWATARTVAMWLVHSRMDSLVAAGGEASVFALRGVPGWAPELGVVYPHVHAKVLSVDGRACALGSANLDVTASYWESELLLVLEDAAVAGALEAKVEALLASSVRVDRDDPAWQRLARRREWLRHWPGVLSV